MKLQLSLGFLLKLGFIVLELGLESCLELLVLFEFLVEGVDLLLEVLHLLFLYNFVLLHFLRSSFFLLAFFLALAECLTDTLAYHVLHAFSLALEHLPPVSLQLLQHLRRLSQLRLNLPLLLLVLELVVLQHVLDLLVVLLVTQ